MTTFSAVLVPANLYLANSLATVLSDCDLYRLLMFHVPHLLSLFHCFFISKDQLKSEAFVNGS